ncbi:TPA: hypothetical protein N0F65_008807 [Lagenidium giganteum]|uniref:Cystatin n=1 Tax=Lagenidium giganteum TaxID=4803 RepID=A0AAV2YYM3_9STRA|nr:TPA: hypothetical protein N0F65_008807 [Lagenidium giganteum]
MAITKIAVIAVAALACAAAQEEIMTGGWQDANVTAENTQLLATALGDKTHYTADVQQPICVQHVRAVRTQVVSGINYRYDVMACPVKTVVPSGTCVDVNCRAFPFQVVVYSQPWTHTLEVQSIGMLE